MLFKALISVAIFNNFISSIPAGNKSHLLDRVHIFKPLASHPDPLRALTAQFAQRIPGSDTVILSRSIGVPNSPSNITDSGLRPR